MDYTKLTINNFIGDLPRIFNKNFEDLKKLFDSFIQTSGTGAVTLKGNGAVLNGEFSSIKSNTIRANNIVIIDGSSAYTLKEYIRQCIEEVAAENETEN